MFLHQFQGVLTISKRWDVWNAVSERENMSNNDDEPIVVQVVLSR